MEQVIKKDVAFMKSAAQNYQTLEVFGEVPQVAIPPSCNKS